jgi:Ferritin-like domain
MWRTCERTTPARHPRSGANSSSGRWSADTPRAGRAAADLKLEQAARPALQEAIAYCETVRDCISREILEDILASEEERIDFLEIQLDLIGKEGLQNWLQSQAGSVS